MEGKVWTVAARMCSPVLLGFDAGYDHEHLLNWCIILNIIYHTRCMLEKLYQGEQFDYTVGAYLLMLCSNKMLHIRYGSY